MIRRPPSPTLFPYPTLSRPPLAADGDAELEPHENPERPPVHDASGRAHLHGGDHAVDDQLADPQDGQRDERPDDPERQDRQDRKSTRLNSSHGYISYAVFCL